MSVSSLAGAIAQRDTGAPFRFGVVQDNAPDLIVRLGDDSSGDVTNPAVLTDYDPVIGDVVLCAMIPGGGFVILGGVSTGVVAGSNLPVGAIIDYAGTAAPSVNWLMCYGQAVAVASYPDLHAVIGYAFGGAGANFNLPDLRGRAVYGIDNMGGSDAGRLSLANTIGTTGGDQTVSIGVANLPSHTHDLAHGHTASGSSSGSVSGSTTATSHGHSGSSTAATSHGHSGSTTGGESSHTHTTNGQSQSHAHATAADGTSFVVSVGSGGDVFDGAGASYRWNFGASYTGTDDANQDHNHGSTNGGSSHSHSVTVATESAHTHGVTVATESAHTHGWSGSISVSTSVTVNAASGSTGGAGSGTALDVLSPAMVLNKIIRAK